MQALQNSLAAHNSCFKVGGAGVAESRSSCRMSVHGPTTSRIRAAGLGRFRLGSRADRSLGCTNARPRKIPNSVESSAVSVNASTKKGESSDEASRPGNSRLVELAGDELEVASEDGSVSQTGAETSDVFHVDRSHIPDVYHKKEPGNGFGQTKLGRPKTGALEVDGFSIEGVSVGGQETCVMLPALKLAFDIGRCPERAVYQDILFITHAHMDHIGGLIMYVASRGHLKRKVPTVVVPKVVKATVEKLFEIQRELDDSPLPVNLIGMDIGDEFDLGKGFVIKAFKTYHVVPSQGYLIYSEKQKLKAEYAGLPGKEIKALKGSGAEVTEIVKTPEFAFTGDTTSQFILDDRNKDVLDAKLLVMESTFLDNYVSIEIANEYGHTHLFEIIALADRFKNKNICLIHFSARYSQKDIFKAIAEIPPPLQGRVVALTEGFA